MNEAFKNNIHIETSSAFDINIVENLMANGKINKSTLYVTVLKGTNTLKILHLINNGHKNILLLIILKS
jgi:arginine decarboxylase